MWPDWLVLNFTRSMSYSKVLYSSYSIPYRLLPEVENEICTHNQSWFHVHILMTVAGILIKINIDSFFHVVCYLVNDTKNNNNNDTNKCKWVWKSISLVWVERKSSLWKYLFSWEGQKILFSCKINQKLLIIRRRKSEK